MTTIGRRELLAALGGAAAAWPIAARAQPTGKLPTIGFLGTTTASAWGPWIAAFLQRLRELGWIEGRTVAIEYRWADGRTGRFAPRGREDREGADHRLLRQDRGTETTARDVQRPQL